MKQLLLEILIWGFTAGMTVNVWFLRLLIQKIKQFDRLNVRLKEKFERLESILKGK